MFEVVAREMGREESKWALLMQSVLSGRALSVTLALGAEIKKEYSRVKEEVVKA